MSSEKGTMGGEQYAFRYNRKDLILYALSIGMGSRDDDDVKDNLRFLYEGHPRFSSLPTFCLAFTFWSNQRHRDQTSGRIPRFPPPLMAAEEVIPQRFQRGNVELKARPIIHTWQSIEWQKSLPIGDENGCAIDTFTDLDIILLQPKSIGTFVTSQSKIMYKAASSNQKELLCTMQSTALVLGIAKDIVSAYDSGIAKLTSAPKIPEDTRPLLEWTYHTAPNQALLYRLASGDSNHIHVDTSASEMMGSDKKAPILHGLFTLAVAFRGLLKVVPDADQRIRKLEARFTQPAFVGDALVVKIWKTRNSPIEFVFTVTNKEFGVVVVDNGFAQMSSIVAKSSINLSRL